MKAENELIELAMHHNDNIANKAMKELRERFDKTYGWCEDCDGYVCKEKDCCLNRVDMKHNCLNCKYYLNDSTTYTSGYTGYCQNKTLNEPNIPIELPLQRIKNHKKMVTFKDGYMCEHLEYKKLTF